MTGTPPRVKSGRFWRYVRGSKPRKDQARKAKVGRKPYLFLLEVNLGGGLQADPILTLNPPGGHPPGGYASGGHTSRRAPSGRGGYPPGFAAVPIGHGHHGHPHHLPVNTSGWYTLTGTPPGQKWPILEIRSGKHPTQRPSQKSESR